MMTYLYSKGEQSGQVALFNHTGIDTKYYRNQVTKSEVFPRSTHQFLNKIVVKAFKEAKEERIHIEPRLMSIDTF